MNIDSVYNLGRRFKLPISLPKVDKKLKFVFFEYDTAEILSTAIIVFFVIVISGFFIRLDNTTQGISSLFVIHYASTSYFTVTAPAGSLTACPMIAASSTPTCRSLLSSNSAPSGLKQISKPPEV